jgi:hypothetical protein
MKNIKSLSNSEFVILKLAYDEYSKLTKINPLHVCDVTEVLGKTEFIFKFQYNPSIVQNFSRAFLGITAYDNNKRCWHVPASWFTRDRVRNFCQRNAIIMTGKAQDVLNELPDSMPERPDPKRDKWYINKPSEWRSSTPQN